MTGRFVVALACASLVASLAAAEAQTATAPTPTDAPAAGPAKRSRTPRPAQLIILANASASRATKVTISGEDRTATLSKPLAPNAKTTLKLPKLKGCMVSVAATFEGEGQVDIGAFDICKDKTIRFTD